MSFLQSLIRGYFRDQRTQVVRDELADGWRVSVFYSEFDLALLGHNADAAREILRPLVPTRKPRRRRLHWGRCRPRSGILRLEMRSRFGTPPSKSTWRNDVWVNNKLGAP